MAKVKFVKKEKPKRDDRVKSIQIIPARINNEQIQVIKMLDEKAAKRGHYIESVFFNWR